MSLGHISVGQILSYLDLGVLLLVIVKLLGLGLFRTYVWLLPYLAADLLESVLAAFVPRTATLYGVIYVVGQGLKLLIAVAVVLELYWLALEGRAALAHFGRRTVGYLLLAAAVVGIAGLGLDSHVPPGRSPYLYWFFLFERTMAGSLAVFLLLISAFMTWFPVQMRRNVALYIYGFLGYFATRFVGLLAIAVLPLGWKTGIDDVLLIVPITCLIVWLIGLNRKGEQTTTMIGQRWNPSEARRLSLQLDAINASLVRFVR